jgi:hypothetical protein
MRKLVLLLAALGAAAAVPAQGSKVIPSPWGTVEGNSRSTYPFGRANAAVQILADGPVVSAGSAAITALGFRADGWPANSYAPYAKAYKVTAWTTGVTAAAMTTDPVANRGSGPALVVFDASLNLPASAPQPVLPRPWSVRFAFNQPLPFDPTKGNLLLEVATNDAIAPSPWTIDAVNVRTTAPIGGQVQQLSAGCSGGGSTLTMKVTDGVIGSYLDLAFTSNTNGAFPQLLAMIGTGLYPAPIDLAPGGMPGCFLEVAPILAIPVLESTSGGYPSVLIPIPNSKDWVGFAAYAQTFGWTTKPTLAGSAMTPAWVMVVGDSAPVVTSQMAFFTGTMWSKGAGQYVPVFRLEGALP